MRVIVSTTLKDVFTQFAVVDSFSRLRDLTNVTHVIVHSFNDTEFDAGTVFPELKSAGVAQFVYISESPSTMIKMLVSGVGGTYIEDEFYLSDEEELLALLNDIDSTEKKEDTSLATPSLLLVKEFIQGFAAGDKRINTPIYLERVNNAITELAEQNKRQEMQISAMGTTAIEIFRKAGAIVKSLDEQRMHIEQQLQELEENQTTTTTKASFGNSVMFFSPYKYIGNAKVVVVREYSPCRYLTSFMLGYLNHLHYELNKRCKLIFVHQKGAGVSLKYDEYTAITQDSMQIASLYDSEIIATNNPKKEVMKDLLSKPLDIFVVVDRLYGTQDIVTGRVVHINVASGQSDVVKFNLNPEETIFSTVKQPKQLFHLPTIKEYPTQVESRLSAYNQLFSSYYKVIDQKVGI